VQQPAKFELVINLKTATALEGRERPAAPDSILLTDPVGTMPSSARKCGGRRIDMLVTKNGGRLTPAIEEIINER
jgi:hypothetical protein